MTLHNLTEHIPTKIMDRARPYAKNGSITLLRVVPGNKSTKYSASVAGKGDHYRVAVEITDDSEVINHECDCPFDGDLCKHQAALLLVIANKEADSSVDEPLDGSVTTKKNGKLAAAEVLFDKLSKEELSGFMKHAFERDPQLRKEFVATFSAKTAASKKDYKEIITAALQGLKGARSFRDRGAVVRSMQVVWKLLTQAEEGITTHPARTLQITQAVLEKLVPALQYVDDSNGDLGGGIEQAVHLMYLVSETAQEEPLRAEWFEWLVKSAQHKDYQGWDCSWDFATLAALVATPNEERKVVAMATAMKQEKEKETWLADYAAEKASKVLLAFIEKNKTKEETEAFILQNVHHDGIRNMALKHYLSNKNFASAIKLCREGIKLAVEKKLPGLVVQWYEKLMEICKSQGDQRGVKECATYLFYKSHADIRLYRILKKTTIDVEWPKEKSALLRHLEKTSDAHLLATICVEEADTVRLLDALKATRHISHLQEFGRHLPEEDKTTLQELYFNLLIKQLEWSVTRDNYRDVAGILKKMTKTFDGESIGNFVREAKKKYAHRPALVEELSKIGAA
ncbi:SWIM zinc finger family protein [Chryseolinea sp. T2]|uniref:SWIM zinc finger family protein n=1 Tax=Chryseolinea sp. T2 TaxID=3129255 RepID=UPI003077B2D3